ncbi:hypothetical protein [Fluviicola sp.]|uniref:hypothetical protein n=1 Tax=Fluviicola sp. TaxID=1917219 RepID=UPI003D2E9783
MRTKIFPALLAITILAGCGQNSENKEEEKQSSNEKAFAEFSMYPDEMTTAYEKGNFSDSLADFDDNKSVMNTCDGVLAVVYQKLSLKTDKEYLEKLNYLYESTSQQDLNSRKGSSLGISVPDYGSLSWGSNKSKVRKLYEKYKTQVNYSLSYNEVIELNETYSRSEDVEKAVDAWTACVRDTYKIPYLRYTESSDSTLMVEFEMQPNQYRGPRDKVRVTDIVFSDNLTFVKANFSKNGKIRYSGTYTLKFKRKNSGKAFVKVDLEEGKIIPVEIPSNKPLPTWGTETVKESYQYDVDINVSANWMRFTAPDGSVQTIKFKNQDRSHYRLSFNIKTILKNPKAVIYDYYYSPTKGGLGDYQKQGIKLEPDGTLSVDCYMVTGSKKMTGKFTIFYGISKLVCKANCPEEE